LNVAVVTGAGRGIGRATALAFAERGCHLALLGRNRDALERTAADVLAWGGGSVAIPCDVSRVSDVHRAACEVMRVFGAPTIVVNNAGVVHRAWVEETTDEQWDEVINVNLKGAFLVTRAFLASMRNAKRGRIVNVASISATLGTPMLSAYCASKWGVVGFTKALSEELRGSGVQALSVLPGSVDTEMLRGSGFPPQMTAREIAGVIVYAALDAPAAMNGSSIEAFGP
jgi:3-oxoacyl-[acyl-carrier protein] reductase